MHVHIYTLFVMFVFLARSSSSAAGLLKLALFSYSVRQMATHSRHSSSALSAGSYITDTALANVLKTLKNNPDLFPDSISRHAIKRERDDHVKVETLHGPLLSTIEFRLEEPSETRHVHFVSPAAILAHAASQSQNYGQLLHTTVSTYEPTPLKPLRIVVYSDEIAPGNVLKHDNKRRLQTLYWNIVEVGALALSNEDTWFVLTSVRSNIVNRMAGGMGQLFEHVLQSFFSPGASFEDGLLINTSSGPCVIFARIDIKLGDESALKSAFDVKGASGSLICMLCRNITSHHSRIDEHDRSNFFLASTCTDASRFVPQTDQTVADAVSILQNSSGIVNKTTFQRMQQALGINYAPHGMLFSMRLVGKISMVDSVMFDWMHIYMSSGIWSKEAGLLLGKLAAAGISHSFIHTHIQVYTWPRWITSKAATGRLMFQKRSGPGDLKCTASEGLSMFKVFQFFLWREVVPHADADVLSAIRCYFALCKVISMLLAIPKGGVAHEDLRRCIVMHLDMYLATYTADNWIPKCHYALHLPHHLQAKGTLLSCWTHERKHKQIKKFANELDNTSHTFELNVITHQVFCQIEALKTDDALVSHKARLINPKLASADLNSLVCHLLHQEQFTTKHWFDRKNIFCQI
jgi:hypothetical protein